MPGPTDTRFHRPPVRIGLASARTLNAQLQHDSQRLAMGAGGYGEREARFSSVPIMLRFQRNAGPASNIALRSVKPINFTRRKRGFPVPAEQLEAAQAAAVQAHARRR